MGNSSAPFLYGHPDAFTFEGPTDRPFNPKAVTESSWTRPAPKRKQKGPLVNFNQQPGSYSNTLNGRPRWTPMSPRTKGKVFYGRRTQLGLRVLELIGALGSLFCAIVVKNIAATIVWIVRVGPSIAILHTLYAIYHLCRSPVTRPPASQASYMLFASTLDLGLVPFYGFAAYIGYTEYTSDTYSWGTLFSTDVDVIMTIAKATFYLSVVNGGLHLISLGISAFLFNIFRQIAHLPPDLNPLEDNLTARHHKRTKSELTEKHASNSTLDSTLSAAQPLISAPRTIPFTHTRAQSLEDNSLRVPIDTTKQRGTSQTSIPQMPFQYRANTLEDTTYELPPQEQDIVTRSTASIPCSTPVRQPSPEVPNRSQCVSPASDNWVAYSSRAASPVEDDKEEKKAPRDSSSVYSRAETPASANGMIDWMSLAQKYGWEIGETISEDLRGEYESLAMHEHYGNDDDTHNVRKNGLFDHDEHDIGDNRIDIYQDHGDSDNESVTDALMVNPLGLNPPTPRPIFDSAEPKKTPSRLVLGDIPNLSPTPPHKVPPLDSSDKDGHFYGDLDGKAGLRNVLDATSNREQKKTKLVKRRPDKHNSYGSLKQRDTDIVEEDHESAPALDPTATERDRKGRVISNSGADFARRGVQGSSLSYGNYIAGLGVGRRRDVSGKMAEEGRGGINSPKPAGSGSGNPNTSPIRAAGWARFAGL
ncbi:uncharacterized protein BJX67DRAFT_369299 [Aspergillus lucknowensis]|uniref:DUF4203 domain-containing protein n=1 Tax=Aspergillus lucknowensis TaxID=176173 RepID=A0ABR4M856_9EURO